MVRALRPVNDSNDWKLPTVPEMEPLKRQRSLIYTRLCQKRVKCPSQCWPRLFYSHPRQLPCAQHPVLKSTHLPYPTFFASTKPSSKRIVPTDNMRPKLHDEYTRHLWLGLIKSEFWWHICSGCWVYDWGIQHHMCAVHLEKILRMGGCPVVVTHWQNTGSSS